MATWTNEELETEVRILRQQYSTLNTAADIAALAILNASRHETILAEIAAIKTRLTDLEDAMIATQDNIADHETRLAALEA